MNKCVDIIKLSFHIIAFTYDSILPYDGNLHNTLNAIASFFRIECNETCCATANMKYMLHNPTTHFPFTLYIKSND